MGRRSKRSLSGEEQDLWKKVIRDAEPLTPSQLEKPVAAPKFPITTPKKTKAKPAIPPAPIPKFRIGERAGHTAPIPAKSPPPAMDRRTFTKMRRGKISPDARIDLHGMTLQQAHPALIGFIQRSHAKGARLVLVITGKGKQKPDIETMPQRVGVLRHQVPQWLKMQPLARLVLEISESHVSHGGAGAFYVYLRRSR